MTLGLLDDKIRGVRERLTDERTERLELAKKILPFGVYYLDVALGGIIPRDLILVGARTGHGKTELCTAIAAENVKLGKRVDYFALEGEHLEIERRIKYKLLADLAYKKLGIAACRKFDYQSWYMGKLDRLVAGLEKQVDEEIFEKFGLMHSFYREGDFTATDLERHFLAIQDQTDLIILDHFHFLDTDDQNENRGYAMAAKKIRDVAFSMNKPVIVVAHVRKSERKTKALIPSIDDFHGTSNLPKIMTRAIMISPSPEKSSVRHVWNTFMHVAKNRLEGSRTKYVATVQYNAQTRTYENSFVLGQMAIGDETWKALPAEDQPEWARDKNIQAKQGASHDFREPGEDDE